MPNRSAEYESHKAEMAEKSRQNSVAGRDISPLPEVADPARRESCRTSLRLFCETYLGAQFPMSWSDDHITAITRLETVGIDGGQFAFAMPRGSGKTTLCQATAIWATLYAHRRFVVLIGATEPAAEELLDAVRVELETNDLLAADFPEVCYPIGRLDGIVHRANGQHIDGERTRMSWTAKEMVFPTVSGSKCSGIVIRVAGITGRVRGMRAVTSAGESIRPDLVIVDDPQTDDSARSPSQNDYREKVLTSAVLGLSGPGKRIAAIMPCTVIVQGDMADRLLDRDRNPQWHGERAKLVYAFPTDEKKWDEYARIRREDLRSGGTGAAGTEYYRENRKAMDAGAKVGWEERFEPGELSAIQHAMNIRIDKPHAFAAEYQNEPLAETLASNLPEIVIDDVIRKLSGTERLVVPRECDRLTAFIDVGSRVLWYAVVAWDRSFGGTIIDYGPWPRQNRAFFAAHDARPNLETLYPTHQEPARVYEGLRTLVSEVIGRRYVRDGTGESHVERCLIDSGWMPDTIHKFCRESPLSAILLPSKGHAAGPKATPIGEWAKRPGERIGWNWRLNPQTGGGRGRLCVFDPNVWKTFTAERLLAPPGTPGALNLYGRESYAHQLLADHFTAEYRQRSEGNGRTIDEWKLKPTRKDNHLFDAVVGAAVAASVQGLEWQAGALAGAVVSTPRPARMANRSAPRKHITPGAKHITRGSAA